MKSVPLPLFLLAVAIPVGALVWVKSEQGELEGRLASLEGAQATARSAAGDALEGGVEGPTLEGTPAWQLAVDDMKLELAGVEERVRKLADRPAVQGTEGGAAAAIDAQDPAFEGAVRDVVMDLAEDVRFRTRLGVSGAPGLGKKPPFHRLAEVLELDAVQEETLRGELVDMKQSFFALLSEERTDGVIVLERMAEADGLPEHDPNRAKIFIEVLSLDIPGSDQTYLERMMEDVGGMRTRVREHLRPQQREIWDTLDLDWMGLEVE